MVDRPTVALLTLGCAKNLVDSEQIATLLEQHGVRVATELAGASVAIVNTCGFIGPAKQESIDTILETGAHKGQGGLHTILVTGCLSERYGDELRELLPEADIILGIDPEGTAREVLAAMGITAHAPAPGAVLRQHRLTPPAWAYLRISEGCDNRCAYCAIPMVRGPHGSFPRGRLLDEARFLVERGARELNVIAQDTTSYGLDTEGRQSLHLLLRDLCGIDRLRWVRLLYCHPAHIYDELLDVMANEEKICPYVDLPLQHVNDRILTAMGRKIGRAQIESVIETIRDRIPGVTLRTTFLTGFPGETDAEFEELLEFIHLTRFDRVGCFAYSREEGTPAAEMPDQIPASIAEERRAAVMIEQQRIAFDLAAARVGEVALVLLEEHDVAEGELRPARSRREAPDVDPVVLIEGGAAVPPAGHFTQVRIVASSGYDCVAHLLTEE